MSIDGNFIRSAKDPAAMTALQQQAKQGTRRVQGFGLKANNKQSKKSKANEHGQNVDKSSVRKGHEIETHVTMAKVIWNLHGTTNRTGSDDRTGADVATSQGKRRSRATRSLT
jgi:hypothetical protein